MPLDMVLKKRFEDQRGSLGEWLESMGSRVEEFGHQLRRDKLSVSKALRTQLDETQHRLEASLVDLRRARTRWLMAQRQRGLERDSLTAREVRALKRAFRNASRSVKASLREWEGLLADYMAVHAAAPALA